MLMDYSTFTPSVLVTLTSSYSSPTKPNSQDDEQQQRKGSAECGVCEHSETDANSSSISSDGEDDAESTADSDTFFNTKNASNQLEEDDLLEACSCTTGEEMPGIYIDDDEDMAAAMSCRGAEKELESYEEDEIRKGKRKREEDKAFWEACLAYGY